MLNDSAVDLSSLEVHYSLLQHFLCFATWTFTVQHLFDCSVTIMLFRICSYMNQFISFCLISMIIHLPLYTNRTYLFNLNFPSEDDITSHLPKIMFQVILLAKITNYPWVYSLSPSMAPAATQLTNYMGPICCRSTAICCSHRIQPCTCLHLPFLL